VYLYNNVFNNSRDHFKKFEMNLMNIKYEKKNLEYCNQYFSPLKGQFFLIDFCLYDIYIWQNFNINLNITI
jgi:hypothetical protein